MTGGIAISASRADPLGVLGVVHGRAVLSAPTLMTTTPAAGASHAACANARSSVESRSTSETIAIAMPSAPRQIASRSRVQCFIVDRFVVVIRRLKDGDDAGEAGESLEGIIRLFEPHGRARVRFSHAASCEETASITVSKLPGANTATCSW